jgi:hypothetical protein
MVPTGTKGCLSIPVSVTKSGLKVLQPLILVGKYQPGLKGDNLVPVGVTNPD